MAGSQLSRDSVLRDWSHRYLTSTALWETSDAKIIKQFLYCLVIFYYFLNTVFRKAGNITKRYIKVKSDLKQFL